MQKRRAFQTFSRPENIKKFVTFALAKRPGGPGARMYDLLMRKFFQDEFGKEVQDLVSKWSVRCWSCSLEGPDLKQCVECKVAQYCSKECQRTDWKNCHKIQHNK